MDRTSAILPVHATDTLTQHHNHYNRLLPTKWTFEWYSALPTLPYLHYFPGPNTWDTVKTTRISN